MRRILLAAALAAALAAVPAASPEASGSVLPGDGFAPGWARSEPPRAYPGNRLFDHIDGGAELYVEFGFETLALQRYAKGEDELVLEIYEMTGPEAALGLYLMKCGRETPLAEIPARNSSEAAQFTILKGRYFIHVNNPSAREDLVPAMTTLAARALEPLPDERPADLLSLLPADGLVPGSPFLFRGPVGLQSVSTGHREPMTTRKPGAISSSWSPIRTPPVPRRLLPVCPRDSTRTSGSSTRGRPGSSSKTSRKNSAWPSSGGIGSR
jgi:hypothetical protein